MLIDRVILSGIAVGGLPVVAVARGVGHRTTDGTSGGDKRDGNAKISPAEKS